MSTNSIAVPAGAAWQPSSVHFKDETGRVFKNWEVLGLDRKRSKRSGIGYWRCRCLVCKKKIRSIPGATLRAGKSSSCGCDRATKLRAWWERFSPMVGKRFERGVVKERERNGWSVKCDCGNFYWAKTITLTSGHTRSCGCLGREAGHRNRKDYTGHKQGLLTFREFKNGKWIADCECGNQKAVSKASIKHGVQSCGCLVKQRILERIKAGMLFKKKNNYPGEPGRNEHGPRVQIGEFGDPALVDGKPKPLPFFGSFKVIKALVAAGARGLSKDQLEKANPRGRAILIKLRQDEDWARVIVRPKVRGDRYRIL